MAAEALQLRLATLQVVSLAWLGMPPGVAISAVAGLNGPGVGRLRVTGSTVAWRAPRSSAFGVAVDIAATGIYTLRDGENPDKWLQIYAFPDYLQDATAPVYLEEKYGNVMTSDFAAGTVATGTVNTFTLNLYNAGTLPMTDVRVWLSPLDSELPSAGMAGVFSVRSPARGGRIENRAARGSMHFNGSRVAGVMAPLASGGPRQRSAGAAMRVTFAPLSPRMDYTVSISSDNVSFYTPREEYDPTTLVYASLAPGASSNLYVRRTIPAGMASTPRARTDLRTSFNSL